jgi:hypothetical protein
MYFLHPKKTIQGVSEIRVLILTSERTRQFMKLLFSKFFCLFFCSHENFNFDYLIFSITMHLF